MAILTGDRVALLLDATAESAQQQILFDRDETDSYRIRFEEVRAASRQLTRAEVMPALPVGSRWAEAVGWESYVVFPVKDLGAHDAALVGIEYVVPHPSRGAYPVFAGVVIPIADVASALRAIAEGLDPENTFAVAATYGVVPSDAQSVDQHRHKAAWILRSASAAFDSGAQPLVRTAILTEDEVPSAGTLLSGSILLGTVSPLRSRFSWKARASLRLSSRIEVTTLLLLLALL